MSKKIIQFEHEGQVGIIEIAGKTTFVRWGGMGFQAEATQGQLKQAVDDAIERSTEKFPGYIPLKIETLEVCGIEHSLRAMRNPMMSHSKSSLEADLALAAKLVKAGDEHGKAIRGCIVYFEMEFQIGWMLEWDTYRIGVEVLSTSSTMHLDHRGLKGPELAAAKQANLPNVVYRQTSMASYQALRRIYFQRRNHRHPDWSEVFCVWIESLPYFNQLIAPEVANASS